MMCSPGRFEWRRLINLTTFILLALVFGILTGILVNTLVDDPDSRKDIAASFDLLTTTFLRLIKMIISPLVFSVLSVAVARMSGGSEIGRIGIKTVAWFFLASTCSLLLGMLLVNIFQPGIA